MRWLFTLLLVLTVSCSTFLPKKVELLQDKVQRFPERRASESEVQRQAADQAANMAKATAMLAALTRANSNVVWSAENTAVLAGAVSESLGPPLRVSRQSATNLAAELRHSVAKLNQRVEEFKQDNNSNAGKKIEGTGLVQVSYFAWVGGFVALLFVGYVVMKVVLTALAAANPGVSMGLNVAQLGAKGLSKGFAQLIKGGQKFKEELETKIDDPAVKEKVLELFRVAHTQAQDEEIQQVVKHLKS